METEAAVSRHYRRAQFEATIRNALVRAGKDPDRLDPADIAALDEFHLGGLPATQALAEAMAIGPGMRLLDIGSGLGGPARQFACRGATVEGIDLTPDFVAVATALTEATGLEDRVSFRLGSALALPHEDGSFDAATLIHVGMNIPDKAGLFAEAARVIRHGGRLGIFDVMRVGEGEISYPIPWAAGPETSFVESPTAYGAALAAAGFHVAGEEDRSGFVLEIAAGMRARAEAEGRPVLGLHLVMGPDAPARLGAVLGCVERRIFAPVQMIAERR